MTDRLSTGSLVLDQALGGGLLPGTLTVVVGATGIGKTQLGIQFANGGQPRGMIVDMTARGDSQGHAAYAQRLADWNLSPFPPEAPRDLAHFFDERFDFDYLSAVTHRGRQVSRSQMDDEEWRQWQADWNSQMRRLVGFLYGGLAAKRERIVVDGVEPAEDPRDSAQLHLFDFLYHKVIRQDADWTARELFREHYRAMAPQVARHTYEPGRTCCLLLVTTTELMLDQLLATPHACRDLIANANTVLLMGKVPGADRMGRALYVAKHRGSACLDGMLPFEMGQRGLRFAGE